jgi:hypothetical protein
MASLFRVHNLFLLSLLWGAARPVSSAELKGVQMPDEVEAGGHKLVLNGLGMRLATFLKVKVYVGGLYLEAKSKDAAAILASNAPKVVLMEFLRDADVEAVRKTYHETFDENCGDRCEALTPRFEKFLALMTDVRKGDRMRIDFLPTATELVIRNEKKGSVEGADLGRAMLSVWLGPHPPNKALRAGMLGL